MNTAKKWYETIVILRPNIAEGEVGAVAEKISGIIGQEGGEIAAQANWGKKKLAYLVKKEKKGHYLFFHYEAPPSTLPPMDHYFKVTDGIIKFLTVLGEAPKPVEPEPEETDAGENPEAASKEAACSLGDKKA